MYVVDGHIALFFLLNMDVAFLHLLCGTYTSLNVVAHNMENLK